MFIKLERIDNITLLDPLKLCFNFKINTKNNQFNNKFNRACFLMKSFYITEFYNNLILISMSLF